MTFAVRLPRREIVRLGRSGHGSPRHSHKRACGHDARVNQMQLGLALPVAVEPKVAAARLFDPCVGDEIFRLAAKFDKFPFRLWHTTGHPRQSQELPAYTPGLRKQPDITDFVPSCAGMVKAPESAA